MTRLVLRGGVYYYRAKVPKALRTILQRRELSFSLHTSDRGTAEALALEMSAGQLRLCRALRQAPGPMTRDQVDRLVSHYMTSFLENREEDSIVLGDLPADSGAARRAWVTEELAAAEDDLLHNRLTATERLAAELLRETGTSLTAIGAEGFRRLCFRLLSARVDVMREDAKRLPSGPPQGTPSATLPAPPSPRLSELVRAYLAHRDASAPLPKNTRTEMVAALSALVSIMGDPELAAVRARDALDFARQYSMLPQRWRSRFRGKSAKDVLRETEGRDTARSAPGTVKKELAGC